MVRGKGNNGSLKLVQIFLEVARLEPLIKESLLLRRFGFGLKQVDPHELKSSHDPKVLDLTF